MLLFACAPVRVPPLPHTHTHTPYRGAPGIGGRRRERRERRERVPAAVDGRQHAGLPIGRRYRLLQPPRARAEWGQLGLHIEH